MAYAQPEAFKGLQEHSAHNERKRIQLAQRLNRPVADAPRSAANVAPMQLLSLLASVQGGKGRGGGGMSFPSGKGGGKLVKALRGADSVEELTSIINSRFPGLNSPQAHHDETKRSRDITLFAGSSKKETKKLNHLFRAMMKAFGSGKFTRGAYGGHDDHLHFEFAGRKNLRLTELIFDPIGYYFNH